MLSLSPSKVNTYLQCPFKYRCEVDTDVRKKYRKDTVYTIFGNLIHACLNDLYKRTKKEDRSFQKLKDLFKEKFIKDFENHKKIFKTKDNIILYVKKSQEMFKNFIGSELFDAEPISTEEYPKCIINNELELGGKFDRIDLVGNEIRLIDYKTGRLKEDAIDKFQLNLYELLLNKCRPNNPVKEKLLYYLEENKIIKYPSMEDKVVETEERLLAIADAISKDKEFIPKPNNMCRFCDYITICPIQNKRQPEIIKCLKDTS